MTVQGGIGLGGGVVFDPNGSSPGYNPVDKQSYVAIGVTGEAGIASGILGVNYEQHEGVRYDNSGFSRYNTPPDAGFSVAGIFDGRFGARLGGAIGVQGTWCNVP